MIPKKKSVKPNGFSLIELVIVIAVTGILASVVIPSYTRLQEKAKDTALKSVMHGYQISLETHMIQTGAYPTGTDVHIAQLQTTLEQANILSQKMTNPYTGQPFADQDPSGKILYTYQTATGGYQLVGYGLKNVAIVATIKTD